MSVEGSLSPASQAPRLLRHLACGTVAVLVTVVPACEKGRPDSYVLRSAAASSGRGFAEARLVPCGAQWCESLWIGPSEDEVTQVAMLPKAQQCDEIAWALDGRRVGFLLDGHQLRLYAAETHAPAGQVNLVAPDGPPTSRVARGVTFSQNGAAITFDDCPRGRSGCRPGMVAIR